MKRFVVDGAKVKAIRQEREQLATQKEVAYAAGISERTLRNIENGNVEVRADACRRLAGALEVRLEDIVFAANGPRLVASEPAPTAAPETGPTLVPRFDTDIASFTQDENKLFKLASENSELVSELAVTLNPETELYVEELLSILERVSQDRWSGERALGNSEGVRVRRRMRELIVLLKGNDIWLYVTTHLKAYPESHVVLENGPRNYRSQIIIAFGPPGEYGEESLTVTIDHGQPWMCDFSSLPF